MTQIGKKGNLLNIIKVAAYDETVTIKYWYLVIELRIVRKTQKSAIKIANKHLKTLLPTEAYLLEQKKLSVIDEPKKKDKKKKKVFTIGITKN